MRFGLRELILLIVLLAVPVASYYFVFMPQNEEILQAEGEIEHKRQMLEKLRQATSASADLERANAEIRSSIEAIEARLPTDKELDSVVRQVSELAVAAGLESPSITSQKPLSAASYMEQPLEMKIEGDFRGFYEFLLQLEQLPRITRVPSMKITRSQDIDGHMKAEFTLSIYFEDQGKSS